MFDFYYQIGSHRRKLFQAVGSHCSIGSARSNDLVIDSRQLSKRQAELRLEDSGVFIRDLGSLTGCWVNRERVVEQGPLSDLDEIEVGDVRITLKSIRLSLTPMNSDGSLNDRSGNEPIVATHDTAQSPTLLSGDKPDVSSSEIPPPNDEALAYWGRIIHEQLLFQMDLQRKDVNRMSDESLRRESLELIKNIAAGLNDQLPESIDRQQLISNVLNESVGLGPLEDLLQDESITEIMVNNYREIFIERNGKLEQSRVTFSSDATVSAVIDRIISPLGRRIDESSPIVDARLKDGSRVNAIIPPLALKGPSLTIRKFPKNRLRFSDLVASDAISQSMVDFLKVCVEMRKNIIVSGGTGSGKTTLLNVLSNFIPVTDRIVTIEDAAELKLAQPNLVSLESRPPNLEGRGEIPIRDLVRNSLRMRPDRIVVGECRGGEALDMLQAMNTGHNGSLTTIHANNPRDVLSRLEVLVLMAGMDLPIPAIREQVASAVDLIIQQTRFPCGARKITRITEVVGVESGTVQLQDIFVYGQRGVDEHGRVKGNFAATGAIPTFYEELRDLGYEVDLSSFSPVTERVHS
jgi:pilus assembly protein CpaF